MENIKRGIFPFLIGISALSVSISAAFYSVSGLSKLFAGASFEVIVMASSLEVAKLVTATLLHTYWGVINKLLRIYLSVATFILVLITSMGIYGFLSAAYQETYNKLNAVENQKSFIQQKVDFYQTDVNRYDEELKRISNNIGTLSNAKASSIQVRDTSVVGGIRTTISTSELRMAQKRIDVEESNRKEIQTKREIVADSLQKFQLQILELDNNNEVAGELGPLQYLSGLTGVSMDKIINWLLLVIIFVFDPLAIALVIAANFAFEKAYPKKTYKENLYGEKVENKTEDIKEVVNSYDIPQDKIEDWDVTLNDGLEEESPHEDDWVIVDEDKEEDLDSSPAIIENLDVNPSIEAKKKIKDLRNKVGGNLLNYPHVLKEINDLKKIINKDDDLIIRY
jgi:hypothetical protein